jgi:hypothetical protein
MSHEVQQGPTTSNYSIVTLPSGRDDHRSCALRFMFLLTTRLAAWLRLARREETWKTAEILVLRHQLAVLQRQQPQELLAVGLFGGEPGTETTAIPPAGSLLALRHEQVRRCHCRTGFRPGRTPAPAPATPATGRTASAVSCLLHKDCMAIASASHLAGLARAHRPGDRRSFVVSQRWHSAASFHRRSCVRGRGRPP